MRFLMKISTRFSSVITHTCLGIDDSEMSNLSNYEGCGLTLSLGRKLVYMCYCSWDYTSNNFPLLFYIKCNLKVLHSFTSLWIFVFIWNLTYTTQDLYTKDSQITHKEGVLLKHSGGTQLRKASIFRGKN